MTPDEYCLHCAQSGSSTFYWGFRLIDARRRRAMMALYAFCHEVDNVVDQSNAAPEIIALKLAWWRQEIGQVYAATATNSPQHPVSRALMAIVRDFSLDQAYFLAILDGMELDLTQNRFADKAALRQYCDCVAGAVGMLSAQVFGYHNPQTLVYAEHLGYAMQLTNILRDVREDGARGRIYLAQQDLLTFAVSEQQILQPEGHEQALLPLLTHYIELAQQAFTQSMACLPSEDYHQQRPGLLIAAFYQKVLARIAADPMALLQRRIRLNVAEKFWVVVRHFLGR